MLKHFRTKNCKSCDATFSPTSSTQKYCSSCKEKVRENYKKEYYNIVRSIKGTKSLSSRCSICRLCGKEFVPTTHNQLSCSKNCILEIKKIGDRKRYYDNHEKKLEWQKNYYHSNYKRHLLYRAKDRAKKLNLEFNITIDDIILNEYCPILNIKLAYGHKEDKNIKVASNPSLDRIDITKGYIKGNICVISMKANAMKNSGTKEELILFAKNIERYLCREKHHIENLNVDVNAEANVDVQ
jgi:hypothetical protein